MSDAEKPDRDFLIEEAKYGRLSPADAEARAKRQGFGPLAGCPNRDNHKAVIEPWWTLPMVMAWILWRDTERVVEFYDPFRTQCFDWHHRKWRIGFSGPVHEGYFLEPRRPATLSTVKMSKWFDEASDDQNSGTQKTSISEEDLMRALKNGSLAATGIPNDDGKRQSIPAHDWNDLTFFEEKGCDIAKRDPFGSGYSDILFDSQVVMSRWPKKPAVKVEYSLPETTKPEGSGYFPLYCAAQWIATKGGHSQFDPEDAAIWENAFRQLLNAISSDLVRVTGVRKGVREKIDGHIFASLNVDYPYSQASISLILAEELYLSSSPYIDEEHWHRGFNDSLQDRSGARWLKLMVLKSDVAKAWPFDSDAVRTGAPGRPTPIHLVRTEHQSRIAAGLAEDNVTREAAYLANWLSETHPTVPQLKAKTIANNIRDNHRMAKRPKR
jgi:hypothetical protein